MSPCRIWGDRSGKWNYKGWRRNSRIKAADGWQLSLGNAPLTLCSITPISRPWNLIFTPSHNTRLNVRILAPEFFRCFVIYRDLSTTIYYIVPKVIFRHSFNIKSVNLINNGVSCHCFLVAVLGSTSFPISFGYFVWGQSWVKNCQK